MKQGNELRTVTGDVLPKTANWVPALQERRQAPTVYESGPIAGVDVQGAFWGHDVSAEHTSGKDRAVGLVIRSAPIFTLQLLLSIALTGLAAMTVWSSATLGPVVLVIMGIWGLLASATYIGLDRQERQFSAGGIERHRIDSATEIALAKLEHDADLRQAALQAYTKAIAGGE